MLGDTGLCMHPGQDAWRIKYEVVVENGTHGNGHRFVSSRAERNQHRRKLHPNVMSWIWMCFMQSGSSSKHSHDARWSGS